MLGIIVLTKNRSDYMFRLLYYFARINCQFPIYIGDSSEGKHLEKLISIVDKFKYKLKIIHKIIYGYRLSSIYNQVLQIVSEKYVVYVGDDDFLLPSSLEKCVNFLESNRDYASVKGLGVVFKLNKKGAFGQLESLGSYNLKALEFESPCQRLDHFLNNYWVPQFSVQRTEKSKESFADVDLLQDEQFCELQNGCMTIIHGKAKLLDCLYLMRQVHEQRETLKNPRGFEWLIQPIWSPCYTIFQKNITKAIIDNEGISAEIASKNLKIYFLSYLKKYIFDYDLNILKEKYSKYSLIKKYIKKLPGSIYFYDLTRNSSPKKKQMRLDYLLKSTSDYHTDFMPIYDTITSSEHNLISDL